MVRTRYAPDRGLQARMGLTMFLLGLVFVALVIALVFVLAAFKQGAGVIIFFAVILGAGLTFGSLFWSDKVALRASGAREVSPAEAPDLHGTIDRLCALADMPKPRVAIAQTDMPNAFATGRNSKNAVLCVTTGLLRRLDQKELEGVHRARDVPRRAQGRRGDDDRLVPRHHRRACWSGSRSMASFSAAAAVAAAAWATTTTAGRCR